MTKIFFLMQCLAKHGPSFIRRFSVRSTGAGALQPPAIAGRRTLRVIAMVMPSAASRGAPAPATSMKVGRKKIHGEAVMGVNIDSPIPEAVLKEIMDQVGIGWHARSCFRPGP